MQLEHAVLKQRLRPNDRREQLLRCALAAFAQNGVARATHSHVAKLAGVAVPTVHSYFRTRDALVSAVLGEVEAYLIAIVRQSLNRRTTVENALTTLATRFAEDALAKPDIIKVWLDWSTGVRAGVWPRYLVLLEKLHAAARKVLARGKREGVLHANIDVRSVARLFIGGGHTVALMQFAGAKPTEMRVFVDHFIESILNIGGVAGKAGQHTGGKALQNPAP